jgi:tetratricopeptide (TPR) repeat protein
MLDPDEISEEILLDPPDNIAIDDYPRSFEEYTSARAELLGFTFINRIRSARAISIHRVVQDAARRNMSVPQYRGVFNACLTLLIDEWPFTEFTWRHSTDRWTLCDKLFEHIVRLMGFSKRIEAQEGHVDSDYDFARLFTDVAFFCHERGRSTLGVGFCETALEVCRILMSHLKRNPKLSKVTTLARVNTTIAEIHHNHGCILAEMNRPAEALKHQLEFNKMMLLELGKHPGTDMRLAMSFNELGVAYMINDRFAEGQECFQRAADEMRRLENFEEWRISLPLVNLGYCYYFNRDFDRAESILNKGLADRVAKFGENDQESFM